jgi:hypothetical protein
LALSATAAPLAGSRTDRATVAVTLAVREPVPAGAEAPRVMVPTDVRVSAYTTEGSHKATQRSTAAVQLRAGASGDSEYEVVSKIELPPGRFRLRIAAHNGLAGKTGSVTVDVIVPDFAGETASMSGVVIGASPGRPSAPRDVFAGVLPIVPTAQRQFARDDRVTAFLQIYQQAPQASPAIVNVRIVDDTDASVLDEQISIAAAQFRPGRILHAAPVEFRLPIERLTAGRYLLTFEASVQGKTLRRDVRFSVR